MSGIVGSKINIRGSGIVAQLGTDGQVLTSNGSGTVGWEDSSSIAAHAVTVTSNQFIFNGETGSPQPDITLIKGMTYKFNLTVTGHPFRIQTQSNNTSGTLYSTGLSHSGGDTGNSAQGKESGTLTFSVSYDAPSTLYYQCANQYVQKQKDQQFHKLPLFWFMGASENLWIGYHFQQPFVAFYWKI